MKIWPTLHSLAFFFVCLGFVPIYDHGMADRDVPAPLLQNLYIDPDHSHPVGATYPPPRVAIVGGSMGGCCAAIALAAEGCVVTIFERTPGELPSQGAGLVIQPDMQAFLDHFRVVEDITSVSFMSSGRQYVDRCGAVIGGDNVPQAFSAWDVLHRALRAAVPNKHYRSGCAISSVRADANGASLWLADGTEVEADLIVGADGPGSTVRSTFLPDERSVYQGYVAWRGLLPEAEAPAAVLDFLAQKFTVYRSEDPAHPGHILAYLIPGAGGETCPGTRRINWVW
jgi:2-polyprenyl-6-methoxyphenol hydroxylase-like FAD-dependent oxidoreductase